MSGVRTNPEPKKTTPQVVLPNFIHDSREGRVECTLCGGHAFSRSPQVILLWQYVHARCCKGSAAHQACADPAGG